MRCFGGIETFVFSVGEADRICTIVLGERASRESKRWNRMTVGVKRLKGKKKMDLGLY